MINIFIRNINNLILMRILNLRSLLINFLLCIVYLKSSCFNTNIVCEIHYPFREKGFDKYEFLKSMTYQLLMYNFVDDFFLGRRPGTVIFRRVIFPQQSLHVIQFFQFPTCSLYSAQAAWKVHSIMNEESTIARVVALN